MVIFFLQLNKQTVSLSLSKTDFSIKLRQAQFDNFENENSNHGC